jgi:hypothetical protein
LLTSNVEHLNLEKASKVNIVVPTSPSIKKPPHHYALPPHQKPIVALSMVKHVGTS